MRLSFLDKSEKFLADEKNSPAGGVARVKGEGSEEHDFMWYR